MKKIIIFIFILTFIVNFTNTNRSFSATSNVPTELNDIESFSDGLKTNDNYNVAIGKTTHKTSTIIKYDEQMNIIKRVEYSSENGVPRSQEFVKVLELDDGSFVVLNYLIGNSQSNGSDDLELVKYDDDLNFVNSYFINSLGNDFYGDLLLSNNEIILTGDASIPNNSKDLFVAKFDLDLNLLNYQTYGTIDTQLIQNSSVINDKLVVNFQDSSANSILVLNSDLSVSQNYSVTDSQNDTIDVSSTIKTSIGNFLTVGTPKNNESSLFLGIYDRELNLVNEVLLPVKNLENINKICDVQELSNGNFVVAASSNKSFSLIESYNLLTLDNNLNVMEYTYVLPSNEYSSNIINNADILETGNAIFYSTVILTSTGEITGEIRQINNG